MRTPVLQVLAAVGKGRAGGKDLARCCSPAAAVGNMPACDVVVVSEVAMHAGQRAGCQGRVRVHTYCSLESVGQ